MTITERCHKILAEYIKPGDTAIDCRAGNGNDTLFLAKAVGPEGRVFAFDVQEEALSATRELLESEGVSNITLVDGITALEGGISIGSAIKQIVLIKDSNANLKLYADALGKTASTVSKDRNLMSLEIQIYPNVIMYNLGYLPGGDHSITTNATETMASLRAAVKIIAPGGVISIITYPGHEEGEKEELTIVKFISELPSSDFESITIKQSNRNSAPVLHLIKKT